MTTEQRFGFPVIPFWSWVHSACDLIFMSGVRHGSMCLKEKCIILSPKPGFFRDPMNGTIELIWFSGLYKIPDKIQCLNTPAQSLVQHHHQLKPELNIEGCPMSGMAPISICSPAVVDAITLNKQGLRLWQRLTANNETQLQRADMMKALLPCCNYV